MGKCRKCGYQSKYIKSIYCNDCWEKVQKENKARYGMRKCICGVKITGNWKYCPSCNKKYNR